MTTTSALQLDSLRDSAATLRIPRIADTARDIDLVPARKVPHPLLVAS